MTNVPVLLKATAPQLKVNLRFPGQYADEESNLYYNGFRSYMPGVGAYTQMDPIGLAAAWNRTGYVGGNTLTRFDPLGLETVILIPMREGWTFAAALTYPDNAGLLTIISHGSTTTVNMKSPALLAALIRNLPSWKAGDHRPILLNACNTGAGGDDSYAAKLSKELGVAVTAPTTQTWNIGPIDIGPFSANAAGDAPNLLKPGSWVTFKK
jgi:RHS repeat-associated protein